MVVPSIVMNGGRYHLKRSSAYYFHASALDELSLITSEGFSQRVPGVVYRNPVGMEGVPLGGLGTGFVALDGPGTLGSHSIFGVPEGAGYPSFNAPPLLVELGTRRMALAYGQYPGCEPIESIEYWGHFPVADLNVHGPLPLEIGLRAYSPFLPGQTILSGIPLMNVRIRLRNLQSDPMVGLLKFGIPGIPVEVIQDFLPEDLTQQMLDDSMGCRGIGVSVQHSDGLRRREHSYALATDQDVASTVAVSDYPMELVRSGAYGLGTGKCLDIAFSIAPGEVQEIPVSLSWWSPYCYTSDGHPRHRAYASRYPNAESVAAQALTQGPSWLKAIFAWQSALYAEEGLPDWTKDLLVNSLYSLPKNTFWFVNPLQDDWWGEKGFFAHSESVDGCPIQDTIVCRIHGHFPLLFFYPDLERAVLNQFRHYQLSSGEIPFAFGPGTAIDTPIYQRQHPINSTEFIHLVYRYYLRTKDLAQLREDFKSVQRALAFAMSLDTDDDGLVNEHSHALPGTGFPANQFYDIWPWRGTSAYVAGIGLSAARCAEQIAELVGDVNFQRSCATLYEKGLKNYQSKLWNGRYFRLYADEPNGSDETCLANQLMSEWMNQVVGFDTMVSSVQIRSVLEVLETWNATKSEWGLANAYNPDGRLGSNQFAPNIFMAENLCADMLASYAQESTGLDWAERIYHALVKTRSMWNQHCLISAETGEPVWGGNYYSNLVIWAFPMAIHQQSIESFVGKGGLVDRIITAGTQALGLP